MEKEEKIDTSGFVEELEKSFDSVIETDDEIAIPVSYENAEEAVLGIFIQDDESASWIAQSGLREEHFQKRKNKLLYPIILDVRLTKGVCNIDLVADACEKIVLPDTGVSLFDYVGGRPELVKINQTPISTDIKTTQAYVDMVFERYKLNKIQESARFLINVKKYDQDNIINKISDLQSVISDKSINSGGLVSVDSLLGDAYIRFKDRLENPDKYQGIKTGFYYIDKFGAVAKKRTTVIGAKTNVGKSIFTSNLIVPMIMKGFVVLWFTPELDKNEVIDRMICSETGICIDDWKNNPENITQAQFKRFIDLQKKINATASRNLFVEDRGVQTASFVLSSCRRHMLNHRVDVVVVDYIQKLKYYGETKKAISDIVGNFYAFGKDNDIAMVLVSQLRRTKEAKPELSDLKESGDIENFSDVVVLLHRNSITNPAERTKGYYMIAKNRQGSTTDEVELVFNEWCLRFNESEKPNEHNSLVNKEDGLL